MTTGARLPEQRWRMKGEPSSPEHMDEALHQMVLNRELLQLPYLERQFKSGSNN